MSDTPIPVDPISGGLKKRSWFKTILLGLLALVVAVLAVQLFYADRYQAVVNVIAENRVGVNPTGERLDFGDLPKNKGATRVVTLQAAGSKQVFVVVWTFGGISDLMKVSKNYFTLEPGKKEKLEFSLYLPDSTPVGMKTGRVYIFKVPKLW